jgi:hypothetical protein
MAAVPPANYHLRMGDIDMQRCVYSVSFLIVSLSACAVPAPADEPAADEPTAQISSALALGEDRVIDDERWGIGPDATGGVFTQTHGVRCHDGFVRVEPAVVSFTGDGRCDFAGWLDQADPGDCEANILIHESGFFRTGSCHVTIYEEPRIVQQTIGITTVNAHVWTASGGGGQSGTSTPLSPLRTDSIWLGPWETFGFSWLDAQRTKFALRTTSGRWVSATGGGGMSGANDGTSPLHTDATWAGPWEQFTIKLDNGSHTATLQTFDGHYITANTGNSFGCLGGPCPLFTDTTGIGELQTFGWFPFQ